MQFMLSALLRCVHVVTAFVCANNGCYSWNAVVLVSV